MGAPVLADEPDGGPSHGAQDPRPLALADAVELFIGRTRHTRTGSPHTERAYRRDLAHYGDFLARRRRAFSAVSRADAELYLSRISAEGAPRSVRRRVSCVRSFYRFLRGVEIVAVNPFDALDLPDFDRKSETHKVLTDDELARVLALLDADVARASAALTRAERGQTRQRAFAVLFTSARRRAALTLMGMSGLRCAEVLNLRSDSITQRPDGFYLTFVGKRAKIRTVPLVGFAYPALWDWLAVRRSVPAASDTVLVTLTGLVVGSKQLRRDCRAVGDRAATRHTLTPHVLRRTFATRTLRASGDIRAVQDLLGHASITTTEVYTYVDEESLRAVVEGTALGSAFAAPARGPVLSARTAHRS